MRSDEKPRIARLSRTVHVASSAGTAPPIGATCEGPLQQVRHSATVPVWRCWRWSFTVCREGRNTAAMTGLAVLRSWQFPHTANVRNRPSQERRHTQVGGVDRLRRFLLEGGVPEMRTGRAEKPIPSASNPSTWSGRLWTGERRCVFPPNHGDYSAVTTGWQFWGVSALVARRRPQTLRAGSPG